MGASQYVWKIPYGLTYPNKSIKAIDKDEPFYILNNTDGSFTMGIDSSVLDILISDILNMNCPFDSGQLRTVSSKHPERCFVVNPNIVIADVTESDIREAQDQQKIADWLKWDLEQYDFTLNPKMVRVIMPAYNAEKTIEKAVRSILMQSYSKLELIIVDDVSTDSTAKIIEKLRQEDVRVRMISLDKNIGVDGARNAGLNNSNGDFIAFQDADDISLKDRLHKQLLPIYEKGALFTVSNIYRSRCNMDELDITDQRSLMDKVERKS